MATLDRWFVPKARPITSFRDGASPHDRRFATRRLVAPRRSRGAWGMCDGGDNDGVEQLLNGDVPLHPALLSRLAEGGYGVGKSLCFVDSELLLVTGSRGLAAFSLGPQDYGPVTADSHLEPSLALRWPDRITGSATLPSQSATVVALGVAEAVGIVDLECVDEGAPRTTRLVTIDATWYGSVTAVAAAAPHTVMAVTRLGGVLLWDVRAKAFGVQWSTRGDRHCTVLGAAPSSACEEFTSVLQLGSDSICVGTAAGRVHQFDLRRGPHGGGQLAAVPPIDAAAAVSRAIGGKSSLGLIPCMKRHRSVPHVVYFNTIGGFCGLLDLNVARLAEASDGDETRNPIVAGVFARDNGTEAGFAVSPTGSLVACPRAVSSSVRLFALQPVVSEAFAGTRGKSTYSNAFAQPVADVTIHPAGEVAGGIWAVTRDCQLHRVDGARAIKHSADDETSSILT